MMGHMIGMAAMAAASMVAVDRVLVREPRSKRDEEVSPHGPEVSRQVRRKIERQTMKRKGMRR